jgi:hypothetical protein
MGASTVRAAKAIMESKPVSGSGLLGLRVAVVRDEEAWFAQGIDVDYFAQGQTPQEAEKNFAEGLRLMIKLHMNEFKNLQYLKPPPPAVSQEYAKMRFAKVEQLPLHAPGPAKVPYKTIKFFVAQA